MRDIKQLVRPNILNLKPYSSARGESGGVEGIFLDANENPFGENNRYPDPYQKTLKQKISQIKNIPAENIFLGNGSDEIIDHIYRIFCNPKEDKALIFNPTFGMYQVAADLNEVEIIDIPLTSDFQVDIEEAKKYFNDEHLKVVIICTPNNPTGNNIHSQDIDFILNNFGGVTVIDEAYIDFSGRESYLKKLNQYPNLIVFQTLSKAWGLAGVRVGMAFAQTEIIKLLNKVKHPYNLSVLNQKVALEALNNIDEFERRKAVILSEKEKMYENLQKLPAVTKIFPSDANFFLVEFFDVKKIFNELLKQGIVVRNQSARINNCLRITVGTSEENGKLIQTLKNLS
ncbi:MAG: histidinol-phosphate transaminase [Flavobacteriaceae bacterium]|jgi:histidinol-phosphate aminotransferase|nr:histidinol-phosphate transaminase [Flavobacteriaceae bacterium]